MRTTATKNNSFQSVNDSDTQGLRKEISQKKQNGLTCNSGRMSMQRYPQNCVQESKEE